MDTAEESPRTGTMIEPGTPVLMTAHNGLDQVSDRLRVGAFGEGAD